MPANPVFAYVFKLMDSNYQSDSQTCLTGRSEMTGLDMNYENSKNVQNLGGNAREKHSMGMSMHGYLGRCSVLLRP